jgi:hypothetical protein
MMKLTIEGTMKLTTSFAREPFEPFGWTREPEELFTCLDAFVGGGEPLPTPESASTASTATPNAVAKRQKTLLQT